LDAESWEIPEKKDRKGSWTGFFPTQNFIRREEDDGTEKKNLSSGSHKRKGREDLEP
jgi:hypothetical protein